MCESTIIYYSYKYSSEWHPKYIMSRLVKNLFAHRYLLYA